MAILSDPVVLIDEDSTRTYGSGTLANVGTTATFINTVPGTWARSAAVTRLSDFPQGCTP